jgi:hypothetical protein
VYRCLLTPSPTGLSACTARRDPAIDRFRIIAAINNGETYADPWPTASSIGINIDNALAMSQSGKYILRVEDNRLVVYEGSGISMSMTWARRCQIAAPQGYLFRTSELTARDGHVYYDSGLCSLKRCWVVLMCIFC